MKSMLGSNSSSLALPSTVRVTLWRTSQELGKKLMTTRLLSSSGASACTELAVAAVNCAP